MTCGKKPSVLVVENHDEVRDLIANLVAAQGWVPISVSGVREAIERLKTDKIDAIISDWELDDGEGNTVLAAARSEGRKIPVIIVSSYATEELRQQACQAGAIALLEKPFRIEKLTEILCREFSEVSPTNA